jgi:hypothetical protein
MKFELVSGEIIKINENRIVEREPFKDMELILVKTSDPRKEILYCGREIK